MTDIGEYDQLLAKANTQLAALQDTYRASVAKRGEAATVPAMARAMLKTDREEVVSVLAAAIHRLANTAPTAELLTVASEFRFKLYPEGHQFDDVAEQAITVAWRGPGDRWAVCDGGFCHDADGNREYESIPSERADEFKARFRFGRDEAARVAREVVVPARRAVYDRLVQRHKATP